MPKKILLLTAAALACCGCNRAEPLPSAKVAGATAPAAPQSAPRSSDWTAGDPLPLLERKLMLPVVELPEFKVSSDIVVYRRPPMPPTESPFPTDDAAITAARSWIETSFGALPAGVSLEVKRINHSSSGREKPEFDWDHGHTIVFCEKYRGVATDGGAVIYLTGRTQFSASVFLFSYKTISGTAKTLVDKKDGVAAWRARFQQRPDAKEILPQFDKKAAPKLKYVWSPPANRGPDGRDVIAPTWVLDDEDTIMVDGHTGEAWFND